MSAKTEYINHKIESLKSDFVINEDTTGEQLREWSRHLVLAELEEWEANNNYTNEEEGINPYF